MDDYEDNKRRYHIRPKSATAVTVGLRLDSLPDDLPNTIVARIQQDLHRNFFDRAAIECTKLKGGDTQIKITKNDINLDLLEVLNGIDRVVLELPLPMVLYIFREDLDNLIDEVGKEYNIKAKIISDKEPMILVCGRLFDALKAKKRIILAIEEILGKSIFYHDGYISSETLLKMNIRVFFLSKINNTGVILGENKEVRSILDEMHRAVIEGIMVIDSFKFAYLLFYQRLKLERMLGEYDCYLMDANNCSDQKAKITIRGFKRVNIRKCCREIKILLQEIVKVAFVEEDLKIEAQEVFVFEVNKQIDNEPSGTDKIDLVHKKLKELRTDVYFNEALQGKNISHNEKIDTSVKYEYKHVESEINFPFEKDGSRREYSSSSSSPWYLDKNIDKLFATCTKHPNKVSCDCPMETNKWGQYIRENHKYIGIGLRSEIKSMIMHSNFLYEIEIDIDPELEDFLCGKKNGKINKICKDNDCEVLIASKIDGGERRIVIYISGPGKYIRSTLSALEDEYPAELSFFLDEKHHRRIIGYGGKNIQKIMKKHGVYIKFMGYDEWSQHGFIGNVVIKTPRRNMSSLIKMKEDVLNLAEEPFDLKEPPRQNVSLYAYFELFIETGELCFDHVILNVVDRPRIYLIEQNDMAKTGNLPNSTLMVLNNKNFLFSTLILNYEIITQDKWVEKKSPASRLFDTILLYSYEPTLKTEKNIDFTDKICKPEDCNEDEYTVGKRKRDDERQGK